MGAAGNHGKHLAHKPLPFLAMGTNLAMENIGQQVCDLVRYHLIKKGMRRMNQKIGIESQPVGLRVGHAGGLATNIALDLRPREKSLEKPLCLEITLLDSGQQLLLELGWQAGG